MKAQILPKEINVSYSSCPDVGREFLSFSIDGWDEVKKLTKKVLLYDGRKFVFTGWNSDRNEIYFARPIGNDTVETAKIL